MIEKRILLIVTGGIAAYKSLELVRLLKRQGIAVRAVMTKSAAEFVTPLSMAVMTEDQVYGHMFDLKEESEIGHIQLSRQADLIVVCPATANIIAKMAAGIADEVLSENELLTATIAHSAVVATKSREVIGIHKEMLYGDTIRSLTGAN